MKHTLGIKTWRKKREAAYQRALKAFQDHNNQRDKQIEDYMHNKERLLKRNLRWFKVCVAKIVGTAVWRKLGWSLHVI